MSDWRLALRTLGRNRGFALVSVLILALGVGANAAIFAVVNAVLLRPLPYPAASRLVRLWETRPPASGSRPDARPQRSPRITVTEIQALQPVLKTLTHLSFTGGPSLMTLTGAGPATRLQGMRVAPSYFDALGVAAHFGRTFDVRDEAPGGDAVLILSDSAWQRHFNGRPDIIGQTVTLASALTPNPAATVRRYEIVGVMPAGFDEVNPQMEFWLPVAWDPKAGGALTARLANGATLASAQTELGAALRGLRHSGADTRYALEPALDGIVEPIKPALVALMGASVFVLLIACVNVANLVLARMNDRQREIAVRAALGATRGRLARHLATESLLIAIGSGIAGVVVAYLALRGFRTLAITMARIDLGAQASFPRLDEVSLDTSVLAFSGVMSVLVSAIVGVLPALVYSRPAPGGPEPSRTTRRGRSRALFVLIEVALAMVLLIGGGLMIHSFARLSRVTLGFDPTSVVTFQLAVPAERYSLPRLKALANEVVERTRRISGVTAAAHGQLPLVMLVDRFGLRRQADERRPSGPDSPMVRLVSADYFRTMGIAIRQGRPFTDQDTDRSTRVMLVNETLAQREFARENPIGARIFFGPDDKPWEIVGVTADVHLYGADQVPTAQVFALPDQWPGDNVFPLGPYFAVRASIDRSELLRQIREIVTTIDPEAGVFNVADMATIVSNRMSRPRLYAVLLGTFAVLAAVLAFIGIYSVVAYTVSQRTREIGIRMALGAAPPRVMRLVMTQSLSLATVGIVVGLVAAILLSRTLGSLLFGIEPLDLLTFVVVTLTFVVVVGVAAWLPSRRATTVEPLIALRAE
jgi:putative ABC transport system permease protein